MFKKYLDHLFDHLRQTVYSGYYSSCEIFDWCKGRRTTSVGLIFSGTSAQLVLRELSTVVKLTTEQRKSSFYPVKSSLKRTVTRTYV